MSAMKLLQSVAALAAALVNWLHDRQLINLARQATRAQKQQEASDALDRAGTGRSNVELDADLHPERLRDNDGFKRD